MEEQKESKGLLVGLSSTLNAMQVKLENIEARLDHDKIGNTKYQKSGTDDQLVKELNEMKKLLDNLTKNVRHEKRILLFPEHNAREYYSAVFKWLFFIIVASYAYLLFRYLITAVVG